VAEHGPVAGAQPPHAAGGTDPQRSARIVRDRAQAAEFLRERHPPDDPLWLGGVEPDALQPGDGDQGLRGGAVRRESPQAFEQSAALAGREARQQFAPLPALIGGGGGLEFGQDIAEFAQAALRGREGGALHNAPGFDFLDATGRVALQGGVPGEARAREFEFADALDDQAGGEQEALQGRAQGGEQLRAEVRMHQPFGRLRLNELLQRRAGAGVTQSAGHVRDVQLIGGQQGLV